MFCPFCVRAKNLLALKEVEYIEIDVDTDPTRRGEMIARAHGQYTVPQIFIDDKHVGGSDDLALLDLDGTLDAMLGRP